MKRYVNGSKKERRVRDRRRILEQRRETPMRKDSWDGRGVIMLMREVDEGRSQGTVKDRQKKLKYVGKV